MILHGDALEQLKTLPDESVHCCVTSPPYWGLRDYGHGGQIGLENTPQEYVDRLVDVFHEVRRVLRIDGTLWVNLGDSYVGTGAKGEYKDLKYPDGRNAQSGTPKNNSVDGLKSKDLVGIPWRVAFALQADGWYLRQDIIWSKPNPMPEPVQDRCTKAHEYVFLLSKSSKYYYDAPSIRNPPSPALIQQINDGYNGSATKDFSDAGVQDASSTKSRIIEFNKHWDKITRDEQMAIGSNKRSVWEVATQGYSGAHFATFPPKLIQPMILAGCPPGGTVLDPFGGSGTTGQVAESLGRKWILIELNEKYIPLIKERTAQVGCL